MPRLRYVGDPKNGGEGHAVLVAYGLEWPKGEPVNVPEELAARLAGNDHFEVVRGRPKKAVADDQDGE